MSERTREAMIASLRRLADYLEAHPDLPVGEWDGADLRHHVAAHNGYNERDVERCIEVVRQAAEVMGVEMKVSEHHEDIHHVAEITFGRSRYRVVAIIPAEQDGGATS